MELFAQKRAFFYQLNQGLFNPMELMELSWNLNNPLYKLLTEKKS